MLIAKCLSRTPDVLVCAVTLTKIRVVSNVRARWRSLLMLSWVMDVDNSTAHSPGLGKWEVTQCLMNRLQPWWRTWFICKEDLFMLVLLKNVIKCYPYDVWVKNTTSTITSSVNLVTRYTLLCGITKSWQGTFILKKWKSRSLYMCLSCVWLWVFHCGVFRKMY